MERLRRAALLLNLIEEMHNNESWCGETHIQKSAYFLQELMKVPLGFDFVLYKHGPFSFDLRDELTALRASELLEVHPQFPYGPKIVPTDRSEYIQGLSTNTLSTFKEKIEFVANKLAPKGSADLERLGTALYVTLRQESGPSEDERSRRLVELKPHISVQCAREAVTEIDGVVNEARIYDT